MVGPQALDKGLPMKARDAFEDPIERIMTH